jgi:hypothetical protein
LQRRGFPAHFWKWDAALFSPLPLGFSSTALQAAPLRTVGGLRQGDPLSPLLFVLAIDPISQILEEATRLGLLHKLHGRGAILQTSLYVDDAAVFMAPSRNTFKTLRPFYNALGKLPVFAQTLWRALLSQ